MRDDGGGRRPGVGARRHPRRRVREEHRVVQRVGAAAVPVVLHLRRQGSVCSWCCGSSRAASPADTHVTQCCARWHVAVASWCPRWSRRHAPRSARGWWRGSVHGARRRSRTRLAEELGLLGAVDAPALLAFRNVDIAYGHVQVVFDLGSTSAARKRWRSSAPTVRVRRCCGQRPACSRPPEDASGSTARTSPGSGTPGCRARLVHVPGGRSVFPSLTVAENLRMGAWLHRRDETFVRDATERARCSPASGHARSRRDGPADSSRCCGRDGTARRAQGAAHRRARSGSPLVVDQILRARAAPRRGRDHRARGAVGDHRAPHGGPRAVPRPGTRRLSRPHGTALRPPGSPAIGLHRAGDRGDGPRLCGSGGAGICPLEPDGRLERTVLRAEEVHRRFAASPPSTA